MSMSVAQSSFADAVSRCGAAARSCAVAVLIGLAVTACSSSSDSYQALRGYQPCHPVDAGSERALSCESAGRNVLVAMATGQKIDESEFVEREVLEEQRGGFITAGGLKVDFGFQYETIINGTPQLTSVMSYNDLLANHGSAPNLNSITVGGDTGSTQIIHMGGPKGIGATILNSQDGININNVATLSIDIIGLGSVHRGGRALNGGGLMPMELKQAIIRTLQ